ncbi:MULTISPECIES: GNAT family N-acetyltransferase [Micromonospora]|uniref:GNAT family N-acetyltransferase n=1 Tax=Micromonospora TaxID=1873 RepID=UPI0007DB6647|nr:MULTISPECIES: GNAT family N-acetyltransferase [unclassified Micromonospora]MBP1783962.1 RimJ/RimL family protein N-acetyltransferase [Micromonospora sp. HB375]MBQ1059439.1 acetyltransferase [Micromonospora sp. C41]MBQ1068224.1 acetyltransferase [Micromonospora sp. D75]MDH6470281.1 RimJ/RimL family protein N-acetyltransferase [Micromonospora sp. H404/HB375]NHO80903.1 acetyltransferase [Micromonospora sp. CMU55-4]
MIHLESISGLGALALEPLRPERDAGLLHGWVIRPRNRFWGMGSHTVDQVRDIYAFVDGLETHHAYLIRLDGEPIGLFQTYQPEADPVGERYPVQPGDVGMHLLLDPPRRYPRGVTGAVFPALMRFLLRDPAARRVVAEPDVRNDAMLRRLRIEGFTFGPDIDMPDKRARLAFLTRERFEAEHPPA